MNDEIKSYNYTFKDWDFSKAKYWKDGFTIKELQSLDKWFPINKPKQES